MLEKKTSGEIDELNYEFVKLKGGNDAHWNKVWVSQKSLIKWLIELEARIMIDYSKESLLLGVRERIKELKGEKE